MCFSVEKPNHLKISIILLKWTITLPVYNHEDYIAIMMNCWWIPSDHLLWSTSWRTTNLKGISYATLSIGFTQSEIQKKRIPCIQWSRSSPPLLSPSPPSVPNRPFQVPKEVAAVYCCTCMLMQIVSCIFKLLIIPSPLRILVGYVVSHWDGNI